MIACDLCSAWYHLQCVKVIEKDATEIPCLVCDQCNYEISLVKEIESTSNKLISSIDNLNSEIAMLKDSLALKRFYQNHGVHSFENSHHIKDQPNNSNPITNQVMDNTPNASYRDSAQYSKASLASLGSKELNSIDTITSVITSNKANLHCDTNSRNSTIMERISHMEGRIDSLSPRVQVAYSGIFKKMGNPDTNRSGQKINPLQK